MSRTKILNVKDLSKILSSRAQSREPFGDFSQPKLGRNDIDLSNREWLSKTNNQTKNLYEIFHKFSLIQKKVIKNNNFTYKVLIQILEKIIENNINVLDIGCGVGTISLYLADRGLNVLGIDISSTAIVNCERSANIIGLKNIAFKKMNFPYEIPQKKFDLVLCNEVLEHLQDDELAIKKIFSLLKKKGIAVISVPSINAPLYKLGLASKFDKKVGHLRRYSSDSLILKFRKQGFQILEVKKTESILRNFLFLNKTASKMIIFIKSFLCNIFYFIDDILLIFGESNIYIIVLKP